MKFKQIRNRSVSKWGPWHVKWMHKNNTCCSSRCTMFLDPLWCLTTEYMLQQLKVTQLVKILPLLKDSQGPPACRCEERCQTPGNFESWEERVRGKREKPRRNGRKWKKKWFSATKESVIQTAKTEGRNTLKSRYFIISFLNLGKVNFMAYAI
jgi:hypothetical protein